ncbi:hypothetical protein AADZ86_14605 [Colwelliaceae bacterium BS250]
MNEILTKLLNGMVFVSLLAFCNIAAAESITVHTANNYPYDNLINRTHQVKVFYTNSDKKMSCRVEVVLDEMKWTSAEMKINQKFSNNDLLSNCLSREAAEQILFQTFVQFGRGL